MLHPFHTDISGIPLPTRFTYPFCYTPHPLCVRAAEEVQQYLARHPEWNEGKMFGVLVVQTAEGELGYLAAFSGILAGQNKLPFFVPPVYDLLQPDGFFKQEEAEISALNARIAQMEQDPEYVQQKTALRQAEANAQTALNAARQALKTAKAQREERRRSSTLTPEEADALIRESQFQKAEYKRLEHRLKEQMNALRLPIETHEASLQALKHERKERSANLQLRLFRQFRLLNYRGEVKDLCELFADTVQRIPPAGAGECAAPKLLQYAYLHGWRPLAMAEFWWGKPSQTEVRRQGCQPDKAAAAGRGGSAAPCSFRSQDPGSERQAHKSHRQGGVFRSYHAAVRPGHQDTNEAQGGVRGIRRGIPGGRYRAVHGTGRVQGHEYWNREFR